MSVILALPRLYDAVVARFAADGLSVPNLFGWRTPPQKYTLGNRICWIPGDTDSGDLGETLPARYPGRNPRSLATLGELFTIEIIASDPDLTKLEHERVQYQAVRELYDAWYRAVYLAAYGTFAVQSSTWMIEKKERRYGAAIRVVCSIEAMIPDAPLTDVSPAAATVTTTQLSLSEIDHIPAP